MITASIISDKKIDKTIDGTPCYLRRTNTEAFTFADNSRLYKTVTDQVKYVTVNVLDAQGNPVLDAQGNPTTKQEIEHISFKNESQKIMYEAEIIAFGQQLTPLIPAGLNEVELDIFKRQQALLFLTINDTELPNGYFGTKLWSVI